MDPTHDILTRGMGPSRSRRPVEDRIAPFIRAYSRFVHHVARRLGVPDRDIPDVAQDVFLKLHEAMSRGLDTSRSLTSWLSVTTFRAARDQKKLNRNARELITETGDVESTASAPNPEEQMAEINVQRVVDSVLNELTPDHRIVLVLSDKDEIPMSEIAADLGIPVATGYSRLRAARQAFARVWERRKLQGAGIMAPFMMWEAHDLLAADRAIPDVPAGFEDEVLRRVAGALARGLGGAAVGAAAAGAAAKLGAMKAGVMVTTSQLATGIVAAMLAGASLYAGLRIALDMPAPSEPTVIAAHDRSTLADAGPTMSAVTAVETASTAIVTAPSVTSSAVMRRASLSATPAEEMRDATLIENARAAIHRNDPRAALAYLARVKNPGYATDKADMEKQASAMLDGGT